MTHMHRFCAPLAAGALLLLLAGCAGTLRQGATTPERPLQTAQMDVLLAKMTPRNEIQEKVKNGLEALRGGDYARATGLFQEVLRRDPSNGHVHFLNALSYHLSFLGGNAKMLDLARAGYITALKFDESNAMAACLLGQIYFHQKKFREAQDQFAYGLTYAPQDPALLHSLAVAAYYSHDLETSRRAARRAYQVAPGAPNSIRDLIFAQASSGDFATTDALLRQLGDAQKNKAPGGDPFWGQMQIERTAGRVADWKNFYASNDALIFKTPSPDIVTYSGDPGEENPFAGQAAPPAPPQQGQATPAARPAARESGARHPKMANVDVVILRTEEVRAEAKGINLLDSLKTTLSGTLIKFDLEEGVDSKGRSTDSRTISIAPSLNLMDLEYDLNIFNDGVNKAEILARPSLLATEGATSNFFSGGELHVQLSSNTFDGSMVDIPIGITLNVTPTFYGDDTMEIVVHAEHSYLQMQSELVGFTAFSQTTKTSVDATAVLKFGETLILSGLSERGSDKSMSGVPLLQDLPVVQYLFSRDEQVKTKKSILILLTPRKAAYARETLTPEELAEQADLEKVRATAPNAKEVVANTNLNAAMAHLGLESEFYRQFRTGDMALNFWENDDSLYGAIKRILGFLYY